MPISDTLVQQDAFSSHKDGTAGLIRLNRRGELVTNDWLQQAALDGRCYNIALAIPDTTATGASSYAATTPAFICTVPTGTTIIPYHIDVCFEDAGGTDNYIIIGCDGANLFTSGGRAASTANNLRTDDPQTSNVANIFEGDSAITMVDPAASERTLFTYVNAFSDATTSPPIQVVWEPRVAPVLVGPATLYFYVYGGTAPEYSFSVQYAEFPTTNVT